MLKEKKVMGRLNYYDRKNFFALECLKTHKLTKPHKTVPLENHSETYNTILYHREIGKLRQV